MSSWLSGIRSTPCQFTSITAWSVAPLLKRLSHSTSASMDSEKCNSSRVEKLFSAFAVQAGGTESFESPSGGCGTHKRCLARGVSEH